MLHRSLSAGPLLAALLIALPLGAQQTTPGTADTTGQATTTATTDYGTTQNADDDEGGFNPGWLGLLGLLGLAGLRKKDHVHHVDTTRTTGTTTGRV